LQYSRLDLVEIHRNDDQQPDECAMKLSLIICTRNRASSLTPCLQSIAKAHRRLNVDLVDVELIAVDNASSDATQAVIEAFAQRQSFPVRYVQAPVPGLSRARNIGVKASSGEWLAFTDDDCIVRPHYFLRLQARLDVRRFQYGMASIVRYNELDDPRIAQCQIEKESLIAKGTRILPAGTIQGANMFMHRSVFDQCGLFDEALGAGTPFPCEDIDLACRASRSGFTGALLPDPIVYHDHGRRTGSAEAQQTLESYDAGRGAYYAKLLINDTPEIWDLWRRSFEYFKDKKQFSRELIAAGEYLAQASLSPGPNRAN